MELGGEAREHTPKLEGKKSPPTGEPARDDAWKGEGVCAATVAAAGGRTDTQVNARPGWPSPCAYRHAVAAEATGLATHHAIKYNRIVLRDARNAPRGAAITKPFGFSILLSGRDRDGSQFGFCPL